MLAVIPVVCILCAWLSDMIIIYIILTGLEGYIRYIDQAKIILPDHIVLSKHDQYEFLCYEWENVCYLFIIWFDLNWFINLNKRSFKLAVKR